MKYFTKFKYLGQDRTKYVKAYSTDEVFAKLFKTHKANSITSITIEGDPLPSRQYNASEILKKEKEAKERKRKGAIKYYQMTGKYVNQK